MINYEGFHNYLCDVIRYYNEKKTLRGFSELQREHHCASISSELFFKYGLNQLKSPDELSKETTKEIRNAIAKCYSKNNAALDERQEDENCGVCTFKKFGVFTELLAEEAEIISEYEENGTIKLPALRHGMLVYIKMQSGKTILDWFDYASYDSKHDELIISCVCDSYRKCEVYPVAPETRSYADGFLPNIHNVYRAWFDETKKKVIEYCKKNKRKYDGKDI